MAVKSELGEAGFEVWDEWSQQADSYNAKDARDVWKSIRANGKVTGGTLFHEARRTVGATMGRTGSLPRKNTKHGEAKLPSGPRRRRSKSGPGTKPRQRGRRRSLQPRLVTQRPIPTPSRKGFPSGRW